MVVVVVVATAAAAAAAVLVLVLVCGVYVLSTRVVLSRTRNPAQECFVSRCFLDYVKVLSYVRRRGRLFPGELAMSPSDGVTDRCV